MKTYRVKMSNGEEFLMTADMVQAAAGIHTNWTGEEDGWAPTPYQTADARHDIRRAAKLASDYAATTPEERATKVVSVDEIN